MHEAGMRQLRHPEGCGGRSTRSSMNAMRRLAAAALTATTLAAAAFSYSQNAHATPDARAGRPREEGRREDPRGMRGFGFSGRAVVSSKDGITARAGMLPRSSDISARYGIEYSDKNGLDARFVFRASGNAGDVTDIFIGADKTVVMTENSIIVTFGFMAAEEKAKKTGDGEEVTARSDEYSRPEELMGGGLVCGVVVNGPCGSVFQAMGQDGWLREFSLDMVNPTAVFELFEPSSDYELLDAGSLAILAKPGSNVVYAIYLSIEGNSATIEKQEIPLFSDSGEHPLPQGTPRLSGNERQMVLSFDNMSFAIMVGEQGNPDSVTVVSTE